MSSQETRFAPPLVNLRPHNPPVPHAIPGSQPVGLWQPQPLQPQPPFAHLWQQPPRRKFGLDTIVSSIFGPPSRPDREWAFVRPHPSSKQRQRASSESTIEIARDFPPPSGSYRQRSAAQGSWSPPPGYVPPRRPTRGAPLPDHPGDDSSRRRRRKSFVSGQYDGPASSDNLKKRPRTRTRTSRKDFTATYSYKHFCAVCGRSRSKTYHAEHPWGPNIKPRIGICHRCRPMREPLQPGSPPPMPHDEVILSESGSEEVEEELIVRSSAKQKGDDKTMAPPIPSIEEDDVRQHRHVRGRSASHPTLTSHKAPGHQVHPPDSLTTLDPTLDGGYDSDGSKHRFGRPVITRKLTYRYVPDTERMAQRAQVPFETEIVIEERRPAARHRHTPSDDSDLTLPPVARGIRHSTAELIASRPGAWSHGKMIQVEKHLEDERRSISSSVSDVKRSETPEDKPEPQPEWYYRRYTRTKAPFLPSSRAYRPPQPPASFRPSRTQSVKSSRPARSVRDQIREEAVYEYDVEPPARRPLQPILQPRARPALRSRAAYIEEEDVEPDYGPDRQSKVAFAPGTKRGGRGNGVPCTPLPQRARDAVEREEEALSDWAESQSDKEQGKKIKKHVGNKARQDGGAFMEFDGHYSETDEIFEPPYGIDGQQDNDRVKNESPPPRPDSFPNHASSGSRRGLLSLQLGVLPRSQSHEARPQPVTTGTFTVDSLLADDPIVTTCFPRKVRSTAASIFSSRSTSAQSSRNTSREPSAEGTPITPSSPPKHHSRRPTLGTRKSSGPAARLVKRMPSPSPIRGTVRSLERSPRAATRPGILPTSPLPLSPLGRDEVVFWALNDKGADKAVAKSAEAKKRPNAARSVSVHGTTGTSREGGKRVASPLRSASTLNWPTGKRKSASDSIVDAGGMGRGG